MARNLIAVTIGNNQTASTVANGHGLRLAGVYLPSNFTGTSFTLQALASSNGSTVGSAVANSSGAISYTCAAGQYIPFDINAVTAGIDQVVIVAGSSQTPTNGVMLVTVWYP